MKFLKGKDAMNNGQTKDWKTLKRERLALQESIKIQQLQQTQRFLEDLDVKIVPQAEALRRQRENRDALEAVDLPNWVFAYQDIWDRLRDGWEFISPFTSKRDRQFGVNFPIFRTEQELSILRAPSRILCSVNNYAKGLLNGLSAFVIGTGYTYRVLPKEDRADKYFCKKVQAELDDFMERTAWDALERELFWRSREDGEFFIRSGLGENGFTWIRTVEPEQVTQMPGTNFEEWSFGIETPREDSQTPLSYWISYESEAVKGEQLFPNEIVHFKANVKRSIKRGLPDFAFSAYDTLVSADKLRRNMGEGAAIQAAIAGIREHQTASLSQVQAFQNSITDFSKTDPITTRTGLTQKMQPGTILDTGQNTKWVNAPAASNAASHVEILDALCRGAAAAWNAPEWLVSASAANMGGYTSSLVAESPFVIRVKAEQKEYARPFRAIMLLVLRHAMEAGRLPPNTLQLIRIEIQPPLIEHRDKLLEAQTNQTYVMMKTKAPQTVMTEIGIDPEEEMTKIEEFDERMGQGGDPLEMPDDEGETAQDPKLGTPTHPMHGSQRERSGYQRGESEPLGMEAREEPVLNSFQLLEAHQNDLEENYGAEVAQELCQVANELLGEEDAIPEPPESSPFLLESVIDRLNQLQEALQNQKTLENVDGQLAELRQLTGSLKEEMLRKQFSPVINLSASEPAVINISPPAIHVEAPNVSVAAPIVNVDVEIPQIKKKKTTHIRDEHGVIVQSIEEPEYKE